jgi:Fe-S oxidoreductase
MREAVALWALMIAAALATAWRARHQIAALRRAKPASRFDRPGERLSGVLVAVGLHRKMIERPLSGILHALIFVSFFVLFTATIDTFGSRLFPGFSLEPVGGATWIALLQDIFALAMLAGVGMALFNRYWLRPSRFQGSNQADAAIIYVLIVVIVLSLLLEAAAAVAEAGPSPWRPVASGLAVLAPHDLANTAAAAFIAWVHMAAILAFLIYIPGSKHRHMFLAAPNLYFRDLAPRGQLPAIPESRATPGVVSFADFDWKQDFDLLACTECGRCQAACPAFAAGLPLNPKSLIMDLRDGLVTGGPASPVIGDWVAEETLWSCTSCRACMEVCPIGIEHVPKIVDLRRSLVEAGRVSKDLQTALTNFTRTGNSMGKPARLRPKWAKDLPFTIKDARSEAVDVLWFVGDFASYDPRAQEVTCHIARLLDAAGVDFGILYEAERNSGNDVRRVGEEGLFELLAQDNIAAIGTCTFKRIMTADPHSLNALRNDYRHFGAGFEVIHHTSLLAALLAEGRLAHVPRPRAIATYHDPCYLGRYNGEFDAPRFLIGASGLELRDMGRCRENSFCCGAGGGRIWQNDEGVKERPSENRIREALTIADVEIFAVACPKDKVMYMAAVDALGVAGRLQVLDVAELLAPAGEAAARRRIEHSTETVS